MVTNEEIIIRRQCKRCKKHYSCTLTKCPFCHKEITLIYYYLDIPDQSEEENWKERKKLAEKNASNLPNKPLC